MSPHSLTPPPPSAHPSPPPLKDLFREDQWLDLKDSRNWAQYGHSSDDYLIGWWCSIYCWPSLLIINSKGMQKDLCCLRKGVTDFLEWSIFSGERGLLQACSKFHPVVVITLLWIGKSFKVTVLHKCVGVCTFARRNPILEYCSLWHCSFHSW